MNPPPVPSTAVYVYCVARAEPFAGDSYHFTAEAIGGSGEPVRTIRYEDLVAMVSVSPNIRYTLRREYLDAHQRVLSEVLARSDVLPVSFGSLARNDEQVLEILLRRQFDDLHSYLEYVKDRIEVDVRVFWEQERLFAEIAEENDAIRDLRERISGNHPDATYYERIQLGEMTEAAIGEKREGEKLSILEFLEPPIIETKLNPEQTDMMVLNAAFLVDRARESELAARVQSLAKEEEGRLAVQYVGPLAPYNFVTLHVTWAG